MVYFKIQHVLISWCYYYMHVSHAYRVVTCNEIRIALYSTDGYQVPHTPAPVPLLSVPQPCSVSQRYSYSFHLISAKIDDKYYGNGGILAYFPFW